MKNSWAKVAGLLGIAYCIVGFFLVFLGWNGTASKDDTPAQIPYVVSGGIAGLGLIIVGSALIVAHSLRTDRVELRGAIDDLRAAVERTWRRDRRLGRSRRRRLWVGGRERHRARWVGELPPSRMLTDRGADRRGVDDQRRGGGSRPVAVPHLQPGHGRLTTTTPGTGSTLLAAAQCGRLLVEVDVGIVILDRSIRVVDDT